MKLETVHLKLSLAWVCAFATMAAVGGNQPPERKHSNIERLSMERLKAVHEDVLKMKAQRVVLPAVPGLNDYRCILHAHAEDSAHTAGTLPEMLADAKKAGISAILLTDHFRPPRDFIDGRWRGMKDGVLFIPGSEIRGFLIYPMASILAKLEQPTPDFVSTVTQGEGMIFLSHTEERTDHSLEGLTGVEIYNRHYDAKRDMLSLVSLALKLTDPKQLAELQEAVRLYPDELLGFQCDYPQVYLDKWDSGTTTRRLTGVAANDCHHNQVMIVKMVDEDTVLLGTNVDKDVGMRKIGSLLRPGVKELNKGRKPGDIVASVDLDPYYRSFLNSSTHVLASKLDEEHIRAALKGGRAFVAHDWMCEATGFSFAAIGTDGRRLGEMGDEVKLAPGLKLSARLPVAASVRLICNGEEILKFEQTSLPEFKLTKPGVYRLEAWLKLDDELRPWIFSNPIYVR